MLTRVLPFLFFALAVVVYLPSMRGSFIMDDWGYISTNPWIVGPAASPWHFWTTFEQVDFWPLTYTYYWIAWRLFGELTWPYHLVNVALHAVNAYLVYALARRLGSRWALAAGLLFLLHPLHVQAVSWIVQFKTLAATACALAAAIRYSERYALPFRNPERKGVPFSSVWFLAALLFKTSVVMLPAVLLILPQEGSWRDRLKRVAPFAFLSLVFGLITMYVNAQNAGDVLGLPWYERPLLAVITFTFYVTTFFAPENLSLMYPLTAPDITDFSAWFTVALAIGAVVLIWRRISSSNRILLCAYVLLLVPALGLVGIPGMKLSLVADHWAYLPDAFLVMLVAAALKHLPPSTARTCTGFVLFIAAALTFEHARSFQNEESFWLRADEVNAHHPAPAYNLGVVYDKAERVEDAHAWFGRAVMRDPLHGRAWFNLARTQIQRRETAAAEQSLARALAIDPLPETFTALARTQIDQGKRKEAIQTLTLAVQRYPSNNELSAWLHALLQPAEHGSK